MSSFARKVKRNQEKEMLKNCLNLGRFDGDEEKTKKHVDDCEKCRYMGTLRFLVGSRGKFGIRKRDCYFWLKYKRYTYNMPLPKKIFEEVGGSVENLFSLSIKTKEYEDIIENLIDCAMISITMGDGVIEIDRNDNNYIERCFWRHRQCLNNK